MNKQEYLRLLKQQMNTLDTDTSLAIMTHVLHFFDEKSAKGFSEREIIEQLGHPGKLIRNYQPVVDNVDRPSQDEAAIEVIDEKIPLAEDDLKMASTINEISTDPVLSEDSKPLGNSNTGAIVRFLLGLMIGLPVLLVLSAIVLAGFTVAAIAFLQGLIMTFDLPYRIWQFSFTIREDFSLLVGIGLIMVGSGFVTLFLSALIGIYHGFKNLFKGNFR
jgi:uncharacterized membrane protein